MNILIIGGAGFIGSNLSKYFVKNNNNVVVIDNFITGDKNNLKDVLENKNFKLIKGDIINFDFLELPQFDLVYELASPASPALFEKLSFEILKVNSIGLFKTLDFFIKSKSKTFVYSSSSEVYGNPAISPQTESYFGNVHTTGRRSVYDEGKRFAEAVIFAYIRKYKIDARIARIFNTYGPFMNPNDGRIISNFINQAINNKPLTIYGDGQQTRSCCYVTDMIQGLTALGITKNISGEIINLGNPDERKVVEIANLVKKVTNSNSSLVYESLPEDDPKRRWPDITKARRLLSWEPKINLEDGIKLTVDYFKHI